MKEVWQEGHQQREVAGHRQRLKEWHRLHGDGNKQVCARQEEDVEKKKGRLPPGEEVTRAGHLTSKAKPPVTDMG